MLQRLSIAFIGAAAVTLAMFYGMSSIAELFNRPDSQVYMRVLDFIPGSGERRRPSVRMPGDQPDRVKPEFRVDSEATIDSRPEFNNLQQPVNVNLKLDQDTEAD